MAKKSKPPVVKSDDHARQADAEKTMHLRALRDARCGEGLEATPAAA